MTPWKIIIVGSGPAGSATALALAQQAPALARATLMLDKAAHPRSKLCGGGVTPLADEALRALGFWPEIPSFPIHRVRFEVHGSGLMLESEGEPLFRVVDRRLFDEALAREAVARGVTLHEGEAVTGVEVGANGVRVTTSAGCYEVAALVVADGAKSTLRRLLLPDEPSRISRLMEILTPEPANEPLFASHTAIFDFSGIGEGVQGYSWNFPSLRDGQMVMNRGIFDSRIAASAPRADLRAALAAFLPPERPLGHYRLQGHPERWYHPRATVHLPRVLFAGEAAGIEPFVGEGIAFALGYGQQVAASLVRAWERDDFSFADYPQRLRASIGRTMNHRRLAAALLYRLRYPAFWRLCLRLSVPVLRRTLPATIRITSL